jgi:hypothetical protein
MLVPACSYLELMDPFLYACSVFCFVFVAPKLIVGVRFVKSLLGPSRNLKGI